MASVVEICNQALSHLRVGSINSLNESSVQAQQCKLKYPLVRDLLLEQNAWNFSTKIVALALRTDTVFNWRYVYNYPSDCLRVDKLIPNYEMFGDGVQARYPGEINRIDLDAQIPHRVLTVGGDKVIVANQPDLRLEYRSRVEDPTLFSASFVLMIGHYLAADMATVIVGAENGKSLKQENLAMYQALIDNSVANDRNEGYTATLESEFITIRG